MFDDLCSNGDEIYLKIDTQGFELRVQKGADRSLSRIRTIQLEMPLTDLYKGEATFLDL